MFINGELPKDEKYPLSCVYWIYHEDKHTDPRNSGYVGISSKGLPARLRQHEKDVVQGSSLKVHNAMRKYGDKVKAKIDSRNEVNTNVTVLDQQIIEQRKKNELALLKAQENRNKSTGITPELLAQQALDKWDGKLPSTWSGSGLPFVKTIK